MKLSTLPMNSGVLEKDENGGFRFSAVWYNALVNLNTQLQKNLSDEGYILPARNTAGFEHLNIVSLDGSIIYNNQTHNFIGNVNGTLKTFTLT